MEKTIFLTGSTGFVGSYLLIKLLNLNYKVIVLARPKEKTPQERIYDIIKFWDKELVNKLKNLTIFKGDITLNNLGLDKISKKILISNTDEIFHCAATTKFNLPLEEIRKINTEGTKNVLDIALECKNLKKINHISTAFVSGNYKGIFKETDLDLKQGFDTTYEQSKFEAEKLVEKYRKKIWIDVFRPPLIIGDSKTGKTTTFQNAFYQVMHYWSLELFDIFPAKGINVNLIPIDVLIEAILKINENSEIKNQTYHPFSSETIALDDFLYRVSKLIGFKMPDIIKFDELDINKLTPTQKLLLMNNISLFNPYLKLDSTFTVNLLKNYGFEFPKITDKLDIIIKYPFSVKFKEEV